MKIEIEDLKKVKIDPGDVLVYKFDGALRPEQKERLCGSFKKAFPDNKVLFMRKDDELILANMHREFDEVKTL